MSETINWQSLPARQRDAAIAEHIFGLQIYAEFAQGSETELDYGVYFDKQEGIVREIEELPYYTTSMDAAWKIHHHFAELPATDENIEIIDAFVMALNGSYIVHAFSWQEITKWTPETLCIAALQAVGCKVTL